MKGIILAGGSATRLYPMTLACCKQLLPVYDKPMLFYPLSTLLELNCDDILIICRPEDKDDFHRLIHSNFLLGKVKFTITTQSTPRGLADAYIVAEDCGFIDDNTPSYLVLGDNIFDGLCTSHISSAFVGLAVRVSDPQRYGVIEVDDSHEIISIEEKPVNPKSNLAMAGLYYFPKNAPKYARSLKPSARGELEIVDLIKCYDVKFALTPNIAWLDAGIVEAYNDAAQYVKAIQHRTGRMVGSPEYVLHNRGLLTTDEIKTICASQYKNSDYGVSLLNACHS